MRADDKRRRGLSDEDRALWDSVARQIKPLRKRVRPKPVAIAAEPKPVALKPAVTSSGVKAAAPKRAPVMPVIARREVRAIARGKIAIEARLDLHGMTQARAHRTLLSFLHRASADGCAVVLIITGKGRTAAPERERGVLRRQVPLWLEGPEFRALVTGYDTAGIGHGGDGALYVRLRRGR